MLNMVNNNGKKGEKSTMPISFKSKIQVGKRWRICLKQSLTCIHRFPLHQL